jgi:Trypsin-like peptidase domain
MKCQFIFAVMLLCSYAFPDDIPTQGEIIEKNRINVLSFDEHGMLLRSGTGFLWDGSTLVCGYSTVKGASSIKIEEDGLHSYSTRLISFNDFYDFAILKAEEEDMEASTLAGSDTLAVGDRVYFFQRDKGKWQLSEAMVKGWIDSGKGYEMIRLQTFPQKTSGQKDRSTTYEPSPLFNESAKVIGWIYRESIALPLKAMAGYLEARNSTIPLSQVHGTSDVWAPQKVEENAPPGPFECCNMILVEGTKQFPFQVQFPEQWAYQIYPQASRFLLRAKHPQFGISLELRAMPQETDDLSFAVERAETLIFSAMSRSELIPFSTSRLSGFKATYEDLAGENGYSRIIFYTMAKGHFYALSITYPQKHAEELVPVVDMIFASFKI